MNNHRIKRVHHFYYCLLVAVKMYRYERRQLNKIEENTFIYCWLKKAVGNAAFDASLQSEVDWLSEQLRHQGITADMCSVIEHIFLKIDTFLKAK